MEKTATEHSLSVVLSEIVEAFEDAWEVGQPDVAKYLPPASHAEYEAIAVELLCVDLEYRMRDAHPIGGLVESYRTRFPHLLNRKGALQPLLYEEYRLRLSRGESVTAKQYAENYGIDTSRWPLGRMSHVDTVENVAADSTVPQLDSRSKEPRSTFRFPHLGESVAAFKLVEELGVGQFGRVYLAHQADLAHRRVAIKISTELWEESDRLAGLQHTNIMPIYSVHPLGAAQAICMPYLGRRTIRDLLDHARPSMVEAEGNNGTYTISGRVFVDFVQSSGSWQGENVRTSTDSPIAATLETPPILREVASFTHEQMCLWLLARIASGLSHAHDRGILHRDLKPANVLVTSEGQPMILDFNLSQEITHNNEGGLLVGGTLPYMSPEHLRAVADGGATDARSDVYSLGVMLYQLLFGDLPFPVRRGSLQVSVAEMLADRLDIQIPHQGSRATRATQAIVRKCLEADPNNRYQTAESLREDIQRQLDSQSLRHASEPAISRVAKWIRRHPQVTSTSFLSAAFLSILGLAAWGLLARGRQLDRVEAANTYREFKDSVRQARAHLSVPTQDVESLELAFAVAEQKLPLYDIDNPTWRSEKPFRLLSPDQQLDVVDLVTELHFMLAASQEQQAELTTGADRTRLLEVAFALNQKLRNALPESEVPWAVNVQHAELLNAKGATDLSLAFLSSAGEPSKNPSDRYLLSSLLVRKERYQEAIPMLESLSSELPENFYVWHLLGNAYEMTNRLEEADECYSVCRVLVPDSPIGHFKRGVLRLKQQRYVAAERDFTRVLALQPGHAATLINRAQAKRGQQRCNAAIDDLAEAEVSGRYQCKIHLLRATLYDQLGQGDVAMKERAVGVQFQPEDWETWISRGLAKLPYDPDGAEDDLCEATRQRPRDVSALMNLAYVQSEYQHDLAAAIATLDELAAYHLGNFEARVARGVLHGRLGDAVAAVADINAALALDQSPSTLYRAACALALVCDDDTNLQSRATSYLQQAIQRDPAWRNYAESDPDLASLRELPSCQQLLSAAKTLFLAQDQSPAP